MNNISCLVNKAKYLYALYEGLSITVKKKFIKSWIYWNLYWRVCWKKLFHRL